MGAAFILLAAAAVWFDLRRDIIPNRLVFFGMGAGVIFRVSKAFICGTPQDILIMVFETAVLFFCLWPIYSVGGLGAGDCKLLLMAGIFLPVKQAILIIVSTFFIAAAEIILLWVICRVQKKNRRIAAIHFALPFLLAALVCRL